MPGQESLLVAAALFAGVLLALEVGRRAGARHRAAAGREPPGIGVIDGFVFALVGLLIAFTFSGAASRFDKRRDLVVTEANAIGTAWLRLDLLPAPARAVLREDFRGYLDARLAVYRSLPDVAAARVQLDRSAALQQRIWKHAVESSAASQAATMLLLPALNDMFDITTTRSAAALTHMPLLIYALLCALAIIGALLAGFGMGAADRNALTHMILFAATIAAAISVTLDLEYPRLGLIRLDAYDRVLYDLRKSMD